MERDYTVKEMETRKIEVVIVGAGPSGLATAACLKVHGIPNVVLEREECCASLWKLRAYDRLKLHLAKRFCWLPHAPFPDDAPTFIPKDQFVRYVDDYTERFAIDPVLSTTVEHAAYDKASGAWSVIARSSSTDKLTDYRCRFLVVATGENSEGFVPDIPGLKQFPGRAIHSSFFKSGRDYAGKNVLVVGSGNSGMEIAYDLSNHGAKTTIVIRSPLHVMTKEMIYWGMVLLKYLPVTVVDTLALLLAKFKFGDLSKYGIVRPSMGPFKIKLATGTSAVIDVGTIGKIQTGEIKVVKAVEKINGDEVVFADGKKYNYDAIVFATGFKSTAKTWLEDDEVLLDKEGMPNERVPNHWKGKNGIYCVGFARAGLAGVSMDAKNVADDIKNRIKKLSKI
ncbi:putative indole-3-pyruvate monooxygenase YUCCA10 [Canna indica]|uniref:Flavin-containing monooxygenase n=1 Tax=Canna indica TaxID=4628 RepID=A0AAQ3KPU6_9LILI|nr:putative indole-3-pyruvate monooxygenase YUCCA10 [Canna indica]